MFMTFKRSSITLFLDPSYKEKIEYDRDKKVDIILSPSLYWVKKVTLPVKSVREVKKLLPSIFEDLLVSGHYSYSAYKTEGGFFIFAYEDKKVLELLSQNEISAADIKSVHFAQSEFKNLESAIKINEENSLYIQDETVVMAPTEWVKEPQDLDLSSLELSKHTIKLQQYGHIVKNSSLYKIAGVFIALIVLVGIEGFITSYKIGKVNDSKEELFSKYKLQSTMMQNRSTLERYKNIYKMQSSVREYISYFLGMRLQADQKITSMEYANKLLTVSISGVSKSNKKAILSVLDSKNVKYTTSLNKESLKVEMKI
ncbi:hypothetical protein GJV85_00730 [Sulfurimonas aquatica]|uniref:Uncharacterized protein n=1 Tax=Sulfurimonas aquatica TaxID=2672570 RepID=A0A975GBQ7_9BACT|nr:hypothetical protein [Sulfurimonas aquatica]QSZ40702.1 hypothetical protein GJV85_00730 [Sulfurimonas aquatica]